MTTTQYKRGDRHVYRHVAGEHLLISMHRDSVAPMFSFTATGAVIWGALADWTTRDAIAEAILAQFDVPADEAAADVDNFLNQLQEIGALQAREGDT